MFLGDIDQINEWSFFEKVVDAHCVLDETVVRSLSHFLYKYIMLKIKLNDGSCQLLALDDSIEPPGCRTARGGWKQEDR